MAESHTHRLTAKITLVKAVELIASDRFKDSTKKPVRWVLKINPEASKILLRVAGANPNAGWQVLFSCDALSLYGSQIPLAYKGYCAEILDAFIGFVIARDPELIRWVDKNRKSL